MKTLSCSITPFALAGEAVDGVARLLRAVSMVLGIDSQEPQVPEQDADEMDHQPVAAVHLSEVDLRLLPWVRRLDHVVAPPAVLLLAGLPRPAQIADVVLVAWQYLAPSALYVFLNEKVVDRAHRAAGVLRQEVQELRPEGLRIESCFFLSFLWLSADADPCCVSGNMNLADMAI